MINALTAPQFPVQVAPAPCEAMPRVPIAIGLPVYNGERWLEETLVSLLAQTRSDFALWIVDNASTDGTEQICRAFASRDSRICYRRNPFNIGVHRNHNAAFLFSHCTYFKWASANDVCAPQCLERCIEALEADESAVLAYPSAMLFSDSSSRGHPYDDEPDLTSADPVDRFRHVLTQLRLNNAFNGVYRASALGRTSLNREYLGSDIGLLAELALLGRILRVPSRLYFRRMSDGADTTRMSEAEQRAFLSGADRGLRDTPRVLLLWQLAQAVWRTDLVPRERLRAYDYLLRSVWWQRASLFREVYVASFSKVP